MKPDIQQIKRLLSLYYSGLITLQEEIELRRSITDSDSLPDDIKHHADIVLGTSIRPEVDIPTSLRYTLSDSIDRMSHKEKARRRGNKWMTISGIAASVAITASLAAFLIIDSNHSNQYEPTDSEEVSKRTREALMTVAYAFRQADRDMKNSCLILNRLLSEEFAITVDTTERFDVATQNLMTPSSDDNLIPCI